MAIDTHNIVSHSEFKEIIGDILDGVLSGEVSAEDVPAVMVWGAPGVGKSTDVKDIARERGIGFVDVRLAQMESIDIRGLPFPDEKAKNVKWLPSSIFPTDNTKGGILFLDELSSAPKDVQVAAYELILDRQLGGGDIYKLPSKWIIVAAGNRSCDRAVSTTMSSALANRMMHFEMEADIEDWAAWATVNEIHPSVVAFLRFKPKMLLDTEDQNLERGFPTPRSWAKVGRMCVLTKNETRLRKEVYGLVGTSAGHQFMEFYKIAAEMDNVLEMMTNPKIPVKIPTRDDLKYAMTSAMNYHLWRGKDDKDTQNRIGGFIRIAMHLPPAFATMAMTAARMGTEKFTKTQAVMNLMRHPDYKAWRDKFGSNLNESYEV